MTLVRDIEDTAIGVRIVETLEELSVIHWPDCAAVVCRRGAMPEFQAWMDTVDPEQLPRARVILRPEAVRHTVVQICEASGTPGGAQCDRLIDDVAALGQIFAELMRAEWLRLRFDVITTNACWKFHTDAVVARLICAYRGTGTQYGSASNGAAPQRVFTVPTSAPIILRGTTWPERPRSGLQHRSPPIEGTGETRLVLVFDVIDDPEQAD